MQVEFLANDGVPLTATIDGPDSAPAILLLHSLGCAGEMWAPQTSPLCDQFRVIVPDLRGHGASGAPDGPYTLDRLGQDAIALLDHAGIAQAHLCGISLGGVIGQYLATTWPARIAHLVLANTAARIGTTQSWQDRETTVRAQGTSAIADTVLGRFFSPAFTEANPQTVAQFRTTLLATPAQGYAGCCAALRHADLTASAASIAAPTLVIGGATDQSTPPDQARALAAAIPHAHLLMLDAAHLSNIEQPAAFTAALLAHFA
jgi:3-oxoadipate enol-lactonase